MSIPKEKVVFLLTPSYPLSEEELAGRTDERFTDHCSMISDDHFDFLDRKDKTLFTEHNPNIICDWLFNIKKIFVVEYDGNNDTYWSAVYKSKYDLEQLDAYEKYYTELKSEYNVFDKDNPLDFKEEGGPMGDAKEAFMNMLYTPHTYVLDGEDSCNRTGNPPDTIENIFFGAYFFHKGMWCTSYIEGAHGRDRFKFYRDPPTTFFDFAPLQKELTQNKRETEFIKYAPPTPTKDAERIFIRRKFCVTEYFFGNGRETAENTDCTLCGPCGPLREIAGATSVLVEFKFTFDDPIKSIANFNGYQVIDLTYPSCSYIANGILIKVSENNDSCCLNPKLSISYSQAGIIVYSGCGFDSRATGEGLDNLSFPITNASFPVEIKGGQIGLCATGTLTVSVS